MFIDRDVFVSPITDIPYEASVFNGVLQLPNGQIYDPQLNFSAIRIGADIENFYVFTMNNASGEGVLVIQNLATGQITHRIIPVQPTNGAYSWALRHKEVGLDIAVQLFRVDGIHFFNEFGNPNGPVDFNTPYCSTGLNTYTDNHKVITACDPSLEVHIDGVRLVNCAFSRGYTLGGTDVEGRPAMVLFTPSNLRQDAKVYYIETPRAPRLAITSLGLIWAAISGHDTPEPWNIPWVKFPGVEPIPNPPNEIHIKGPLASGTVIIID